MEIFILVWCIIGIIAIIVGLAFFIKARSKGKLKNKKIKEGYVKILGTLGTQTDLYNQCINECAIADPSKQMTPSKGSMMCLEYCDSVISDLARRGGPTYDEDIPVAPIKIKTRIDESFERCGPGKHGAYCRALYSADGSIDDICREKCSYSTLPEEQCVDLCSKSYSSYRERSWMRY